MKNAVLTLVYRWPEAGLRSMLILLIRAYRFLLSPWLGRHCRFEPTCSVYALEAIEDRGAYIGSYLMTRRLLRCHPWCEGGYDPVPRTDRPVGRAY